MSLGRTHHTIIQKPKKIASLSKQSKRSRPLFLSTRTQRCYNNSMSDAISAHYGRKCCFLLYVFLATLTIICIISSLLARLAMSIWELIRALFLSSESNMSICALFDLSMSGKIRNGLLVRSSDESFRSKTCCVIVHCMRLKQPYCKSMGQKKCIEGNFPTLFFNSYSDSPKFFSFIFLSSIKVPFSRRSPET